MKDSLKMNQYENDFNYAVQVTRFILRLNGAWPISRYASNVEKIANGLQIVVCYFFFAFIIVPGFLLMFLKEHDIKRRVKLIGQLLNCCISSVKYSLLVYQASEIQSCLKQVRQDWRDTVDWRDRKAMLSKATMGRKFVIIATAFMYIGALLHRAILPLSKGRMLTPMNTTVRALSCPSYFIKFDEQASPAYEIVFTMQCFAGLFMYSVSCSIAGLTTFFIMHICGQLSILIGKFQHLNDISEPDDRTVLLLLADIVEHQIKVKSLLKQVEETMRYVWLLEILGSSIIICLAGYYIIMEWENSDSTAILTFLVILISITLFIFVNCHVGQLLTDQSIKVGLITSATNWYRFPHKRARSLILIILVSNIPVKISAGKMIEMSLPTFSNIIKTSIAYFNLLRKFMT